MSDVTRQEFDALLTRVAALERGKLVQDLAITAIRWAIPVTLTLIGIVAMIWVGTQ